VVKNRAAFESRYGLGLPIAGEYIGAAGGTLSNSGEDINILGPLNEQLLHFNYDADWYPITNGGGYSWWCAIPTPASCPPCRIPAIRSATASWRPSNLTGGGPGAADPGINPESVVINEGDEQFHRPQRRLDRAEEPHPLHGYQRLVPLQRCAESQEISDPRRHHPPQPGFIVFFAQQSNFGVAGNPGVNTPSRSMRSTAPTILLTNNDGSGNVAGYREFADFGASPPMFPSAVTSRAPAAPISPN
jgi:hypothetical protein